MKKPLVCYLVKGFGKVNDYDISHLFVVQCLRQVLDGLDQLRLANVLAAKTMLFFTKYIWY